MLRSALVREPRCAKDEDGPVLERDPKVHCHGRGKYLAGCRSEKHARRVKRAHCGRVVHSRVGCGPSGVGAESGEPGRAGANGTLLVLRASQAFLVAFPRCRFPALAEDDADGQSGHEREE